MAKITEERVLEALSRVRDPERGKDLVSLGMIGGLAIKDGNVGFSVEVDAARGAGAEPLRKAAEQAVFALDGVTSVTAVLTAHRKAGPAPGGAGPNGGGPDRDGPARDGPARDGQGGSGPGATAPAPSQGPAPRGPGADRIGSIVAIASGKGGVGKSTTAANLALALMAEGARTGLLDADIYGPSMPRMMGVRGKPTTADGKVLDPMTGHGVKLMSMGFLVDEETPMIWRGPMVMSALQQLLHDVAWGPLDVLVVDMPPGTGDAQLTLAQTARLSGAIIVSTPQDIALLDARKGLNMFRKVDVPVLGIVENMSYFQCPHCGERSDVFSHGGARREAERLGVPFLGEIPLDIAIRETSDGGRPIVAAEPDGAHAAAYREIAMQVLDRLDAGTTAAKPAPKIVIR
ncbi:MAG: Mrp/NBP35 family ATP-binding protein [Rhodospirillaceae bacterium]|nr:Mrp/NBP35 family ATP-binding protein [Rhodospirillaceae bacterium]MYB13234.1 Mrp/NBP35 family ATP-binding protein [Rhodospirillaceae bacterium]MYI50387.1 Mrp/NBP35 family ATP-binding protein [Rhodospirillaceae bacterium]